MPNPFSLASTAQSVHDSLEDAYAAIPATKKHLVLVDATTDKGVRALYAQRIPGGWQVALEGAWTGGDHVAGKVSALKAW